MRSAAATEIKKFSYSILENSNVPYQKQIIAMKVGVAASYTTVVGKQSTQIYCICSAVSKLKMNSRR